MKKKNGLEMLRRDMGLAQLQNGLKGVCVTVDGDTRPGHEKEKKERCISKVGALGGDIGDSGHKGVRGKKETMRGRKTV